MYEEILEENPLNWKLLILKPRTTYGRQYLFFAIVEFKHVAKSNLRGRS